MSFLSSGLRGAVRSLAARNGAVKLALDLYRLRGVERARRVGEAGPFGIHNIELTNKCPMKCVMCPRTHEMTRDQGLMEFEIFQAVIDQLAQANPVFGASNVVWLHHFGESLMHPEFGRFVRYGVAKGIRLGMSINPIMLKPEIAAELLDSGISDLRVSLDGHDDESFEKIRGVKNAFERSKRNLLDFLALKMEKGAATRVELSMIGFKMNEGSIPAMERFWSAQPGVDAFLCKEYISFNGADSTVNGMAGERHHKRGRFVACLRPWQTMTVAWDGDVLPCCYDYDKLYVLGNVRRNTLMEIWTGPAMAALRDEFRRNVVSNPLCRACPDLDVPAADPG